MKRKLLLVNGPNLRLLGRREPEIYGHDTLQDIENAARACAAELGFELVCFQSDCEGALITRIGEAPLEGICGIVINPAAHTHYSYALHDALTSVKVPAVEVHLSDINSREGFRKISVVAPACIAQISGRGIDGYFAALDLLKEYEK